MRKGIECQLRLQATPIAQLQLNLNCRDEIIPLLVALKHVYCNPGLRQRLTQLVAEDVNQSTRRDTGRRGLDDWQILVLGILRLNSHLDYDKLQDLAENHASLRTILGVTGWDQEVSFDYRRISKAVSLLKPQTIEQLNQAIVEHGQSLQGAAARSARADSFVIETNIHYPTESSLMYDGIRKLLPIAAELACAASLTGWRQSGHLLGTIKKLHRQINQLSASRIVNKKETLASLYQRMLQRVAMLLDRAKRLIEQLQGRLSPAMLPRVLMLQTWIALTDQVRDTAQRRVIRGERVANSEKLFSLFETHTQLYQRGKAGEPIQYGRLALIVEDGAGFISHYYLLGRQETDQGVILQQSLIAKGKHHGQLSRLSLDRGFHSQENLARLKSQFAEVSCPSRNSKQYAAEVASESAVARRWRHHHSGVESAIGALQRGNGLKRCRDRGEVGLERYLGLAVLARNLQVLGKLLIAREAPSAKAALSQRRSTA